MECPGKCTVSSVAPPGVSGCIVAHLNKLRPRRRSFDVALSLLTCAQSLSKQAKTADVILMSHRDPYHSICSRKLEHMWCKQPTNSNGEYVASNDAGFSKAQDACKNGDEKLEVKGQCQMLMGLQADVYARREVSGTGTIIYSAFGGCMFILHGWTVTST